METPNDYRKAAQLPENYCPLCCREIEDKEPFSAKRENGIWVRYHIHCDIAENSRNAKTVLNEAKILLKPNINLN